MLPVPDGLLGPHGLPLQEVTVRLLQHHFVVVASESDAVSRWVAPNRSKAIVPDPFYGCKQTQRGSLHVPVAVAGPVPHATQSAGSAARVVGGQHAGGGCDAGNEAFMTLLKAASRGHRRTT
ncbi:hypothetical protein AURDEDRAFT_177999 [Auricularia subglabra TFB-10046 SS5]|uniref:Uncharacterized protein n=1 Tax=Auricularia subglabra (strain TFB-10046 / SS5) TaxID=717982 RepID=J0D2P6_AURST|nr:hypothetical protein AURDEDRAFT_177999 [Auricularia subglabra TFB-10046 SS5]